MKIDWLEFDIYCTWAKSVWNAKKSQQPFLLLRCDDKGGIIPSRHLLLHGLSFLPSLLFLLVDLLVGPRLSKELSVWTLAFPLTRSISDGSFLQTFAEDLPVINHNNERRDSDTNARCQNGNYRCRILQYARRSLIWRRVRWMRSFGWTSSPNRKRNPQGEAKESSEYAQILSEIHFL